MCVGDGTELQFMAQVEAAAQTEAQRVALSEQDAKLAHTLAEIKSNQISKEATTFCFFCLLLAGCLRACICNVSSHHRLVCAAKPQTDL
jgi:hypothetical protein